MLYCRFASEKHLGGGTCEKVVWRRHSYSLPIYRHVLRLVSKAKFWKESYIEDIGDQEKILATVFLKEACVANGFGLINSTLLGSG